MAERPFSIAESNPNTEWIRRVVRAVALPREWDRGVLWVSGIALGTVVLHVATGWRYGFHRDELMAIEDARHLAWGFVPYPPMLPFLARVALAMFGTSLVGFRVFAAVAQAAALVLTGLMAKELRLEVRGSRLEESGEWRVASDERKDPFAIQKSEAKELRCEVGGSRLEDDGGARNAQAVMALPRIAVMAAMAGVPFCLGGGALMQYITFDYLCWVLVAYCMVLLLKSDDARWWIGVGAAIGLGLMAKYTMAFFAVGVIAGVLLTRARKFLRSGWLWAGVVTAAAIVAPNVWWQWKHHFVSLEFLRFIHARDVRVGLTDWFLPGQLELTMLAFPLVAAGLWFLLFSESGERYRPLAWMYLVPLALFVAMRGRAYYIAPAYPMLYAAGAVWLERQWRVASGEWREVGEQRSATPRNPGQASGQEPTGNGKWKIENRAGIGLADSPVADLKIGHYTAGSIPRQDRQKGSRYTKTMMRALWVGLILDVGVAAAVALPIAPVNSGWWNVATKVDPIFPEEIGWPEFVETVAGVRNRLPEQERNHVTILAGNYGELGALNLYGGRYGLPRAIGGENSSWERGYGQDRDTVIVTGYSREFLEQHFASCEVGAQVWNRYGVVNEEIVEDSRIFVCRGLKESWPEFWVKLRKFA